MTVPHEGNCERRIGGLKPGRYIVEVSAKRADGTVSDVVSRTVSVVQHQAAQVKFDSEFSEVSGQVFVNDKPADGYVIEFYRAGSTTASSPIIGGSYALAAGAPGEYLARLRDRNRTGFGRPAAERAVTLLSGHNTLDWKIEAASVKVRVENWERIRPLEVRVAGIGEAAVLFGSTSVTVPVTESSEVAVTGLPFGRYRISASEPVPMRKKTTPSEQIELTKAKPELEATLRLSSSSVTVTLRDESGRPVRAPRPPGEELQDGVYLVAVQPGSSIQIHVPGFVSACRVAPSEGAVIDVTLQRGRPRIVTFVPGRPGSVPFMSFMFPGSDCWTTMSVLPFSAVSSEPGRSSFTFTDFPAAGPLGILWNRTGQSEVVALSPSGVVVLRPPTGQHP